MRNGQPLELFGQKPASALAQQTLIHLIQLLGVIVDRPDLIVRVLCKVELEGRLHARRRLGPSWERSGLRSGGGGRIGGVGAQTGRERTKSLATPREGGAAGLESHGGMGGNGWDYKLDRLEQIGRYATLDEAWFANIFWRSRAGTAIFREAAPLPVPGSWTLSFD